jgi:hypothetical protein
MTEPEKVNDFFLLNLLTPIEEVLFMKMNMMWNMVAREKSMHCDVWKVFGIILSKHPLYTAERVLAAHPA